MVDRDHDRHSSDQGNDRDPPRAKGDPDPLAELARLIGQTDPFANFGRANPSHPSRRTQPVDPLPQAYSERVRDQAPDVQPSSGPSWMKNRTLQNRPPLPTPSPVEMPATDDTDINATPHPLHRYAAQQQHDVDHDLPSHESPSFVADPYAHDHAAHDNRATPHEPHYQEEQRYDDALYGAVQPTPEELYAQQQGHGTGYADDAYGYDPDQYAEPEQRKPRRKGLMTVAAVMALAVIGTGGAYAYRNFVGGSRSGEPPVIKADTNPIKVVPPTNATDTAANSKLIQDRIAAGGGEKLVSREETPVDPRDPSKAGPRVVFPPLNANGSPPSTASVSPVGKMAAPQTAPGDEPRRIKTFTVKGDQADANGVPVAKPAPRAPAATATKPPATTNANASGNAPMSLSPQAAAPTDSRSRVAALTPAPVVTSGGHYVQIASQGSESDAQASFKSMQSKYPSVLGSRSAQIKRAEAGDKIVYRVTVGPFASNEEAIQMCGSLKTAGGQCFVPRK